MISEGCAVSRRPPGPYPTTFINLIGALKIALSSTASALLSDILAAQKNLACTYEELGNIESALATRQEVYSGYLRLKGESHADTCLVADNYAKSLGELQRFEEAKSVLRKMMPVVRALGEDHFQTIKMRWRYAEVLYRDPGATLDDIREAVTTLEELEPIARRVLGGTHPDTRGIEHHLRTARAALCARESGTS